MWQTIDSAPKDGTRFLVTGGKLGEDIVITMYQPSHCKGFGVIDSCCGSDDDVEPTHWMPLPEPPNVP